MYFPEQKKPNRFEGQNMGGIKDMLSPPCQNMGGYITPIPPRIYALEVYINMGLYLAAIPGG